MIAQVVGAVAAAGVLFVIASGTASFDLHAGFASNGYGANSPGGYSLLAGFVAEVVLTAFFLIVIMGSTDGRAPKGFAPIAIGLCLTLTNLVCIPVMHRSTPPAAPAPLSSSAAGHCNSCGCSGSLRSSAAHLGGGLYRALFGE